MANKNLCLPDLGNAESITKSKEFDTESLASARIDADKARFQRKMDEIR